MQFAPRRGVCAAMPPVLGPYATSSDMFGDVGLVFVFLHGFTDLNGLEVILRVPKAHVVWLLSFGVLGFCGWPFGWQFF